MIVFGVQQALFFLRMIVQCALLGFLYAVHDPSKLILLSSLSLTLSFLPLSLSSLSLISLAHLSLSSLSLISLSSLSYVSLITFSSLFIFSLISLSHVFLISLCPLSLSSLSSLCSLISLPPQIYVSRGLRPRGLSDARVCEYSTLCGCVSKERDVCALTCEMCVCVC